MSSAATISPSSPGVRIARRARPRLRVGMPLARDQARGAVLGPRAVLRSPRSLSADARGRHRLTCGIAGYGAYLAFDERAASIGSLDAEQRPARRRSC